MPRKFLNGVNLQNGQYDRLRLALNSVSTGTLTGLKPLKWSSTIQNSIGTSDGQSITFTKKGFVFVNVMCETNDVVSCQLRLEINSGLIDLVGSDQYIHSGCFLQNVAVGDYMQLTCQNLGVDTTVNNGFINCVIFGG